ncbi:putative nuclease HARBI1 [Leptopilina boulardi]|uniref:putative nuclease HARBI1 n=1 Tax=Leptopilina boulardi TaxID=63433 RepID=UPI0021F5B9D8|nr:putative nuclease HARBI1 [Leptopilina boulardi]
MAEVDELSMIALSAYEMIFNKEDEDNEEEEEDIICFHISKENNREEHPKNENYFEETIPRFSLSDFQSHFRMTRTTFEELTLILAQDLSTPKLNVPVPKKLAIAIWTFSNQEVYRSIADRFGVSQSTAWTCMLDVASALCARVQDFIQWPTGEAVERNTREFQAFAGFPGVIGVVDGCHIQISAPHENSASYVNRKGYFSINMQGICDAKMKFIHIYAGCCGSVNDARVWQMSDIAEESGRNYDQYFPAETHILGDKIYPNLFNLLPPYKDYGNLLRVQRYYNLLHARTRQIIERTFALLLGRFRRLKYLYLQNVEYASLIILACCCLHNICISLNDQLDNIPNVEVDDLDEQFDDNGDDAPLPEVQPDNVRFSAEIKRNAIANALYINRE